MQSWKDGQGCCPRNNSRRECGIPRRHLRDDDTGNSVPTRLMIDQSGHFSAHSPFTHSRKLGKMRRVLDKTRRILDKMRLVLDKMRLVLDKMRLVLDKMRLVLDKMRLVLDKMRRILDTMRRKLDRMPGRPRCSHGMLRLRSVPRLRPRRNCAQHDPGFECEALQPSFDRQIVRKPDRHGSKRLIKSGA